MYIWCIMLAFKRPWQNRKIVLVLLLLGSVVPVYIIQNHELDVKNWFSPEPKPNRSERNSSVPGSHGKLAEQTGSRFERDVAKFANHVKFNVSDDGKTCLGRRFLVYKCRSTCGGWADRQKGITTVFLLALLTNRTFVIDMQPCDLLDYVQPNLYDWTKCLTVAKGNNANQTFHMTRMNGGMVNLDELIHGKVGSHRIVSIQTNTIGFGAIRKYRLSTLQMPWLNSLTDAEVTGSVLGMLFKPTETMQQSVGHFLKESVGKRTLVCGHIRYGASPTIPGDRLREGTPNVTLVLQFLKKFDRKDGRNAIFIATDANHVRNQSRYYFSSLITTERKIVHVDRIKVEGNGSCAGFFTAILEQILLSKCDVLVLTRSNFGAMAAYMRGHSDKLFLHKRGKSEILGVKNLTEVQKIYKFV